MARDLRTIISQWIYHCGIERSGRAGDTYRCVPIQGRQELLRTLAQTLIDDGYDEAFLGNNHTEATIAEACSPPDGGYRGSKLKQWRGKVVAQWRATVTEFFPGTISAPRNSVRPAAKVPDVVPAQSQPHQLETSIDLAPVKRYGKPLDRTIFSSVPDPVDAIDTDFIREIGLDPADFGANQ